MCGGARPPAGISRQHSVASLCVRLAGGPQLHDHYTALPCPALPCTHLWDLALDELDVAASVLRVLLGLTQPDIAAPRNEIQR
eukprot:COSAG01_NODE_5194_length_4419_cov_6.478752_1_plen_82_part_10